MPSTPVKQAIAASHIFDGSDWQFDHIVLIDDDKIEGIVPASQLPADRQLLQLGNCLLAPGLIDVQVNGGGGVMLNNDLSAEAVSRIASAHRSCGTTSLMPTLISDTPQAQREAVAAVQQAIDKGDNSVLGLHIEGPFFDLARRGTHKADMIRPMDEADINWLCSLNSFPLILTLAPEHASPAAIQQLSQAGLLLCAGHTNANYQTIVDAIANGLRGFTHLYNAMSPLTSREPGTVGAALEDQQTWAGIIADGHHVHPAAIKLAQKLKPEGKLILVSDAMSTVGSEDDSFEIYGEVIREANGCLINAEGNLAGSAISLLDAVRYCHQQLGFEIGQCLRMASLYPAQFLGVDDRLGAIIPGHRADLIALDDNFELSHSWVAGEHLQH